MSAFKINIHVLNKFRAHRKYKYYPDQLGHISKELLALAYESEQEFLSLGEKLQKFFSTSKQIFQQTKLSLEKLSEAGDDNILTIIQHLFEETIPILQHQSENITNVFGEMKPISEKLYHLSKTQEDFNKISRFLRILGISIKIESNRAGDNGQEFMVLSEEIDHLWSNITQKTEELFHQAAGVAKLVEEAAQMMMSNGQHYHTMVNQTQKSIILAMQEVKEMFQLSAQTVGKIAHCIQEISQEIGEIVYSIQSHDITRQQIEHIHQSLDRIRQDFKDYNDHKTVQDPIFNPEINEILLVQIRQLENAVTEIDQSAGQIKKSLTRMAEKSEKENEEIAKFNENACSQKTGKMQQLEKEITQFTSILKEYETLGEQISQALQPAAKSASQISEYMTQMEKVGYGINILSLNALIKAAQNKESGHTFDVLAEGIHQQAGLSSQLSLENHHELEKLTQDNEALAKTLHLISEQKSKAELIINAILQNTSKLHSLNEEISNLVEHLIGQNNQLTREILTAAHNIQFDHLFKAKAYQNLEKLKSIYNDFQEFLLKEPNALDKDFNKTGERLTNQYTMEKERKIHQEVISNLEAPVPPLTKGEIEEFSEGNKDLGENVELF